MPPTPYLLTDDDDDERESEPESKDPRSTPDAVERLLKSRTVFIQGPIQTKLTERVVQQLFLLEEDDGDKPVKVLLNTPGGSATDGFSIYDVIRFVSPRVRILCTGLSASAGTIIMCSVPKEDRLTLPHTRFMLHQPRLFGQLTGTASDLEIEAREMLKLNTLMHGILAEACDQPIDRIARDTKRDFWLDAEESVAYGLVGGIVSTRSEFEEGL